MWEFHQDMHRLTFPYRQNLHAVVHGLSRRLLKSAPLHYRFVCTTHIGARNLPAECGQVAMSPSICSVTTESIWLINFFIVIPVLINYVNRAKYAFEINSPAAIKQIAR